MTKPIGGGKSHPRVLPQIDQQDIQRVGNAVRDDGSPQVPAAAEVEKFQQQSVNSVLDNARDALISEIFARKFAHENRTHTEEFLKIHFRESSISVND
ncbi:hypothetical protein L0337_26250 [candidate division KSB1 bacterium]|nr:hypothetical protein [candidate division KSB1 bacterium]